ncbi:uncharacterized protein MYCFIDRAFT_192899 [Pseudocercospora fijiensis CIRAD86]|uniref:C2H2-type domain-containing protein n=1 Tax=Pseudocercospora fijiensis (strain CIRAD86) TaxID=383855 RepID=N1Q7U3_PSEFD|nr:uncharacterized protein MYCFIDRAFT_192899 [Pseudocercospora fijiensis CIRAD86]EME88830.1 hypothetical protein MYCFIDRAFT_192899 [Pseudocercospora fijiensis CIRAD86]
MASSAAQEALRSPGSLLERQTSSDRTHHCSLCSKSFKRREHYQRHVRSHTNEKPFACRYCAKYYSRKDLVARHEKTLHADRRRSSSASAMIATPSEAVDGFWPGVAAADDLDFQALGIEIDPSLWDKSELAPGASLSPFQLDHDEGNTVDRREQHVEMLLDPALTSVGPVGDAQAQGEVIPAAVAMSPSVAPEPPSPCPEVNISNHALSSALDQITLSSTSGYPPPTLDELRLCISTYFQTFNVHLPLFHTRTFDCASQPPELLLLIGDLVQPNTGPDSGVDLAAARTQFLLSFFAVFSGNQEVVESAFGRLGKLSNAYQLLLRKLRSKNANSIVTTLSWLQWVEHESMKRNLIATTYGVTPALSVPYHGDVELPCSENLWQAESADEWHHLRPAEHTLPSLRDSVNILTLKATAKELPPGAYTWSHFAVVVVMHTMAIHMWHGGYADQENTSLYGTTLARCRDLIKATGEAQCGDWLQAKPSFLFNASCILRICHGRSHPQLLQPDKTALLRGQPEDASIAIQEYATAPMTRSKTMTETIAGVFDGLCASDRRSLLLLRKTVALTWSFEHAIASWDTVLLVSRWLHHMDLLAPQDMDDEEVQLLDHIITVLRTAVCDFGDSTCRSKAASMLRLWVTFYEDTWVWGVVARMGAIYRSLANVYERASPG